MTPVAGTSADALAEPLPRVAEEARPSHGRQPVLALHAVTKRWRGADAPVLDAVNLELFPGQLVWIGGRNGAGKTTLLRIAAGLIDPDEGLVAMRGQSPRRDARAFYARLGVLSAGDRGLHARLTPRQHLDYWARLAMIPRAQRTRAAASAVERFDLHDVLDRRVDRLSMGQRQRVRLASTFLNDPELVMLDEPRSSLDEHAIALVNDAVADVRWRGGAAVWCSPTGEDPPAGADAWYVLVRGRLEDS